MITKRSVADKTGISLAGSYGSAKELTFTRAEKIFELSNHLGPAGGGMLVTISDRRVAVDNGVAANLSTNKLGITRSRETIHNTC